MEGTTMAYHTLHIIISSSLICTIGSNTILLLRIELIKREAAIRTISLPAHLFLHIQIYYYLAYYCINGLFLAGYFPRCLFLAGYLPHCLFMMATEALSPASLEA